MQIEEEVDEKYDKYGGGYDKKGIFVKSLLQWNVLLSARGHNDFGAFDNYIIGKSELFFLFCTKRY